MNIVLHAVNHQRSKVIPGFEPESLDSKSRVLTVTPYDQLRKKKEEEITDTRLIHSELLEFHSYKWWYGQLYL